MRHAAAEKGVTAQKMVEDELKISKMHWSSLHRAYKFTTSDWLPKAAPWAAVLVEQTAQC